MWKDVTNIKRKKINMKTKEQKLETLKAFLKENGFSYEEGYYSESFNVTMALRICNLRIAVFFSQGLERDTELIKKKNQYGVPLCLVYNPFFIRDEETEEFILEKMQNCVFNKMMHLQERWEKKQNKKV